MITSISGENFLPFNKPFQLRIEPGKLTIVTGDSDSDYATTNGTGKTSLMKALLWCLYGKFPGMEEADSVINKTGKKNTVVRVFFTIDGNKYIVERYRKHKEHKSNLYLWCGKQRIAEDIKSTQRHIDNLITQPYEIFKSLLVFTGEREDEFASGTDKDQKKLLDVLVPMAFDHVYDKAAVGFAQASEALDYAQRNMERVKGNIEGFAQKIEDHEVQAKSWSSQRQDHLDRVQAAVDEAKKVVEDMEPTAEQYTETEQRWFTWQEKAGKQREKLQEAMSLAHSTRQTVQSQQQQLAGAKQYVAELDQMHGNALTAFGNRRSTAEAKQLELNGVNPTCPTCKQTVVDQALQAAQQEVTDDIYLVDAEQNQKIEVYKGQKTTADQRVLDITDELSKHSTLDQLNQQYNDAEAAFNAHAPAYDEAMDKFKGFREEMGEFHQSQNQAGIQLQRAESDFTYANAQTNLQQEFADQAKTELEAEQTALVTLQATLADKTKTLRQWEAVRDMFSGKKGGLHHFVFEMVLPEMTAMTQMFLNFFSSNALKVAFRSHKTKGKKVIEGFFVEASRGEVTGFGNLSRGEQRRINVAISLTLYHMACKHVFNPGILFLDEVADSLDDAGRDGIIELLTSFGHEYNTSAVLLTNDHELIAQVHSGYICKMRNNNSTLELIQES